MSNLCGVLLTEVVKRGSPVGVTKPLLIASKSHDQQKNQLLVAWRRLEYVPTV